MYETHLQQLREICDVLRDQGEAQAVILFDRSGQMVTSSGELEGLDTISLASLAAAHMAAARGIGEVLGETFDSVFHESPESCLYLSLVDGRAILAVIYGDDSSLGLLRMRAKVAERDLQKVIAAMVAQHQSAAASGQDITTYEGVPGVKRSML